MAVTFDAVGPGATGQSSTTSPISWSHTCSGTLRAVVVGVAIGGNTGNQGSTAVTYGGVSMTRIGWVNSNNSTDGRVELWGMVNPPTGASTVSVTASGSPAATAVIGGSISFNGVDQTTTFGTGVTAFGSSTTPSVVVTSAVGDMVVDALADANNISSSSKTNRWLKNLNLASGAGNGAQSTAAGAASVTMSYTATSDWWGIVGVTVKQDTGGAGATLPELVMAPYRWS